jgi:hypothetical protein
LRRPKKKQSKVATHGQRKERGESKTSEEAREEPKEEERVEKVDQVRRGRKPKFRAEKSTDGEKPKESTSMIEDSKSEVEEGNSGSPTP